MLSEIDQGLTTGSSHHSRMQILVAQGRQQSPNAYIGIEDALSKVALINARWFLGWECAD